VSKCHVWTGRIVKQAVYPSDVWWCLSAAARWETIMAAFVKPSVNGTGKGGSSGARLEDPKGMKEAPTFLAYMQEGAWPDGEVRETSSCIVCVEDGVWKAGLIEKNTSKILWASSRTFWGLLEALEARLTAETVDWRAQRAQKRKA